MRASAPALGSLVLTALVGLLAAPAASEPVANTPTAPAAKADDAPRIVRVTRELFGTEVVALVSAKGDEGARVASAHVDEALRELERIDQLVDPTREGSDVAKVNAAAGGEPVVVAPETFDMLLEAQRIARLSKGAFDPTFAALDGLWAFDSKPAAKVPTDDEIAARKALISWRDLNLDEPARSAQLKRAGQRVGLGGLAKGYALDRAATLLTERGVADFLLAAGGDIVLRGKRGDRPWMVGVQDPRGDGHFAALEGKDGAVMTTGDYERFFLDGDTRYHHVLDPRTGKPASRIRSVTVTGASGMTADALSTAVFVLGPTKGMRMINRLKGVEAIVVTAKNGVVLSKGLKRKLRWRPPTDAP
jgi:thiamine biosynthesis lipoprotein